MRTLLVSFLLISVSFGQIDDLRKKAEDGNTFAQTDLADLYTKGESVPKDYVEAAKWYRKAAETGSHRGQTGLGLAYVMGHGVPKDNLEAVKWFREAADDGYAAAQVYLGLAFQLGEGVPQDAIEAYAYFNLAGAQFSRFAREELEKLEKTLTPEQITAGQHRSKELQKEIEAKKEFGERVKPEPEPEPFVSRYLKTLEKIKLPVTLAVDEAFTLLDSSGKEVTISQGKKIVVLKRTESGIVTINIGGKLFVGNESRLAEKVRRHEE
jgi:hypothetical protein